MKTSDLRHHLVREIDKGNIDLCLPKVKNKFISNMAKKYGKTNAVIKNTIGIIKDERGITRPGKSWKKPGRKKSGAYKSAEKSKNLRKSPSKEMSICYEIIYYLCVLIAKMGLEVLKSGKKRLVGVYLGTPTAISVSPENATYWKRMFIDNAVVAFLMNMVCWKLHINVGNAVSPKRAKNKIREWVELFGGKVIAIDSYLDSPEYYRYIAKIARKAQKQGRDVLVVFMASGVWKGNNTTYSFQTNFKGASSRLIEDFPNLRIMAMVADTNMKFRVEYLGFSDRRIS